MCNCIETVDAALKERNTRVQTYLIFKPEMPVFPVIGTQQIEKGRGKAKAVAMFPTYCPFCGDRYEQVAV